MQLCTLLNRLFILASWLFTAVVATAAGQVEVDPAKSPVVTSSSEETVSFETEFFESKVRPLLVEHCYECHAGDELNGGLAVDFKGGLLEGGDSGPALIPGKPESSRIVEAMRYDNLDLQMPPDGRLSKDEIAIIEQWIQRGAYDPRKEPRQTNAASSGMSIDEGHEFWSLRPVTDPQVPAVEDSARMQTAVDAFVMHRLDGLGVGLAPPADRRTLLRRVTFDLIGLPPTQDDVQDFLADDRAGAFESVIERLLNSPQYGERWGRHWLDVARYADSNGLDENLAFGNAWRYRDYVVDAFNQDKPFDQFLVEQIAGDLLQNASLESRTGTAFLALGAKVLAEPDREKLIMDTIDEQMDATGKAFMGMTLGCARCHDHKFDPIKQKDYYALAAIFKSTKTFASSNTGAIKHWYEYSFASQEELAELKKIDAEIAAKNATATKFKNAAMAQLRKEVVENAAKYLAASATLSPAAPFPQVEEAAGTELHPRVLQHCRKHLAVRREEPLVRQWRELVDSGAKPSEIEVHFQQLFTKARTQKALLAKNTEPEPRELDPLLSQTLAALDDASGFLAIPPQPEYAMAPATLTEYYALLEDARILESAAPDEPAMMGVSEGKVEKSLPIHIRGSHNNLGEAVEREFPAVMRYASVRPVLPRTQSGRLELARWMASSQHPLTARVYVNRIWNWHFGRGLVGTTENFGVLGDRPSHPELLDWLARNFMQSGWSTKELHRLILNSSVYQMASTHPQAAECLQVDPENRLLWQFRLQRLDAEQLRDSVLAVSGQLELAIGGKSVPLRNRQFVFNHTSVDHTKYDSHRRSLYLPVIRNNLYTLFEQFDFPDPTMPAGHRHQTVVAPQALLMLNDPMIMDASDALATRLVSRFDSEPERAEFAFQAILGRPASPEDIDRAMVFVERASSKLANGADADRDAIFAWSLLCQSLIASSEFAYIR